MKPISKDKLDPNSFKIRCSAIGQIMTNDRSGKAMGKTAKTYCQNWLKEQMYGVRSEFQSKYTGKGLTVEEASIDFAAEKLGWGMVFKNEKWFENDFITGTPDVILPKKVVDLKNSYDPFTFPTFELEIPEDGYDWQLHGYMDMTGKDEAELVYTLMDLPDELLEREMSNFMRKNNLTELTQEQSDELIAMYNYSRIDTDLRIKTFAIKKDPAKIEAVYDRVLQCRSYIAELLNQLNK